MSAAIIIGVAIVTVVYVAAIMVCFLYIRRCVFSCALFVVSYLLLKTSCLQLLNISKVGGETGKSLNTFHKQSAGLCRV